MGTTITCRNTESRRVAKNDISTPFTRRLQKCQSKKIGRNDHQCTCIMHLLREIAVVRYETIHVGVLDKNAGEIGP
jgi:hypothetical protein